MVARSGTASDSVPSPKNPTNLPTTLALRSISVTVRTRSSPCTRMELALEVHADHVGGEEVNRLAEHAGLGLDAAHAPADHADAVDHGVCCRCRRAYRDSSMNRVRPPSCARRGPSTRGSPGARSRFRRHDLEGVERLHSPLQELVALFVPLELQLHVEIERVLRGSRSGRSARSGRPRGRPAPAARSPSRPCPSSAPRCAWRPGRRAAAPR